MLRLKTKPWEFVGKGKNFMTPDVVAYFRCNNYAIELSKGEGFRHEPIYGVTVIPDPDHALSRMFCDRDAAMTFIEGLSSQKTMVA